MLSANDSDGVLSAFQSELSNWIYGPSNCPDIVV